MKTYEDGLNEAWEAAKKITCPNGYTWKELEKIFDNRSIYRIFATNTASEAIEKIREYDEQTNNNNVVHVGDEIYSEMTNCKAVVQYIDAWHGYHCFTNKGDQLVISTEIFNKDWIKTGKNYPQIEEVLKQMQEGEA